MDVLSFYPVSKATQAINVSSSSQSVKVSDERGPIQVRVMNNGTAPVWIAAGDNTVTASASANDIPVGAGGAEVFTFTNTGNGSLYVAAIAAGSTGNVYFTPGRGI